MRMKISALPVCYCAGDCSALRVRRATGLVLIKRLRFDRFPLILDLYCGWRTNFQFVRCPPVKFKLPSLRCIPLNSFFTGSIGDFQPAIGSKVHHQRIRVNRRRGHASLIGWQRRSAIWCCCCRWCRSRSGINICLRRWNNRILLRINSWCWRSYGRCLRVGCGGIHR